MIGGNMASKVFSTGFVFFSLGCASAFAHELPTGDGKVSSEPMAGYVFSCQQRFNPNAPGARGSGSWISGNSYDPARKPVVDGSVKWASKISISVDGGERIIRANNLPANPTGNFPIARSDDAYTYDRNPNRISAHKMVLRLPAIPEPTRSATCVPMGMIGFTLSGAAIFNALDAAGRDAPAHEIQDACSGHPERTGQYHYHSLSNCFDDKRESGHSSLVGYALDGFGIFGYFGENGKLLTNTDLDACHGHSHEILWDGERRVMYHYHTTAAYPYTIGCFRGAPAR
jgi:hypothetical protein